jgi:anti-sigma-K factor RskA
MSDKSEEWDRARDEIISGEYVLGVLSVEDRRRVEARMAVDKRFAQQVRRWQNNLSGFNDEYDDQRPPAELFNRLERRLFGMEPPPASLPARLWGSVALWRGVAAASLVAAAGLAGFQGSGLLPGGNARPLVAELSGQNAPFNLIAAFDAGSGRLSVVPIALKQPEPKSLEVWIIDDGKPPQSVGILPDNGNGEIVVNAALRRLFAEGKTIAITVEPFGGAPEGKPTGPVVASGKTRLL